MGSCIRGAFFVCIVFGIGCGGNTLRLVPEAINQPLPIELQSRVVFTNVGVYQKNPTPLVGHVLFATKAPDGTCPSSYRDADLSLRAYLNNGTSISPDSTATVRYQSKVDDGSKTQGSYLAFSTNLTREQAAEVIVTDTVSVVVPTESIPIAELEALGAQPLGPNDCERYYIRGAILTTLAHKLYSKLEANASAQGGAFAAGTNLYGNGQSFALDMVLGLNLLPIRPHLDGTRGSAPGPDEAAALKKIATLKIAPTGLKVRQ